MLDKRQATIYNLHAALQFESLQMQKGDFYSHRIFKLIRRVSVIREYCEKQRYFSAILNDAWAVMSSHLIIMT
jgi:hypothetical protein